MVKNDTGEVVSFTDVIEDVNYQKVTIRTVQELTAGAVYKITMKFVSILNNSLQGFYRASYVENGIRK